MKFLADECCDIGLIDSLRSDGHDVLFAVESLRGASDTSLLMRAFSEGRILLTEDKDFGELIYRLQYPSHGIILLRFDVTERDLRIPCLRQLLERQPDRVSGAFVVLETGKVRIRPLI